MRVFTIGFTKKSAATFFSVLRSSSAKLLIDVRLNNSSQLAGFAKKDDLQYFLREICAMDYLHLPILAPTQIMLDAFKKEKGDWSIYEHEFLELMKSRGIEDAITREILSDACLLCSEEKPDHCHRRLVAEYLGERWSNLEIIHL